MVNEDDIDEELSISKVCHIIEGECTEAHTLGLEYVSMSLAHS